MIKVVLTGLNGYGAHYVERLLDKQHPEYCLCGVVSTNPSKSEYLKKLEEHQVRIYGSLAECLNQIHADVVLIGTPMHIHQKEIMCALEHHASVYCEKPMVCTVDEHMEIIRFAKKQNCFVAVGFQWSFSDAILGVKKDLLNNVFGSILAAKAIANLQRPKSYYRESSWKGKRSIDGAVVEESVLSNCAAHSLHNLLFLLGDRMDAAAEVGGIKAVCKRAHDIETYDTAVVEAEAKTPAAVRPKLICCATTVSDQPTKPEFTLVCEHAQIIYPYQQEDCVAAVFHDGTVKKYGSPDAGRFEHYEKLIHSCMEQKAPGCSADTALPFMKLIEYLYKNVPVKEFDRNQVLSEGDSIYVEGLAEKLNGIYRGDVELQKDIFHPLYSSGKEC